jgi:hypothetical protein
MLFPAVKAASIRDHAEFARRRSVVEAVDRLGRDSEWIDIGETCATTIARSHDRGDIDRFRGAVARSHSHGSLRTGVVGRDILRRAGFWRDNGTGHFLDRFTGHTYAPPSTG